MQKTIQQAEQDHLIPLYPKRDVALMRGKGIKVWDEHGKEYLDCMMGYGAVLLGHSNKQLEIALSLQMTQITSVHSSFYSETRAKFLEALHRVLPEQLSHSFISNTGTESVEAALKFARLISGRPGVISAKRAYHGRTMGALSVNGTPKYRKPFEPLLSHNTQVAFNDMAALKEAVGDDTGAIILEPIQGEGGVQVPDIGYLKAVRELCDAEDLVLIFDEVQTGYRTGDWLASTQHDVIPDIVCLSKGIGNGIPLAVTAVQTQHVEKIPKGSHGTTFGSNPLACAAGLFVIEYIEEHGLHDNALAMGALLADEVRNFNSNIVREVRSAGAMIGIETKQKAGRLAKQLQEQEGIIVMPTGTNLRLLPPLTITEAQVRDIVTGLYNVLA